MIHSYSSSSLENDDDKESDDDEEIKDIPKDSLKTEKPTKPI